jgi:hypothetical protein
MTQTLFSDIKKTRFRWVDERGIRKFIFIFIFKAHLLRNLDTNENGKVEDVELEEKIEGRIKSHVAKKGHR